MHLQLGQILDPKETRDQKTQLSLLRRLEQKQECREQKQSRVLCMSPAHNTPEAVGKTPKAPLWPDPGHTPTLTPYKEEAWHPLRKPVACSHSPGPQ